ncbi:Bromodomain-containing protein [Rhizoctonia solani AG-1 IA]|uniref:Bromodomain-containing protein n=1 Tax=Thanatephorus cucumeris (strain AG1-IA) TaxID=983506 RepID=L8WQ26_THACA|nr:Bromodomain-containing protein [Rhizoctonia solani AG-1 IA]
MHFCCRHKTSTGGIDLGGNQKFQVVQLGVCLRQSSVQSREIQLSVSVSPLPAMSTTSPNQASKRKRVLGVDASNIIEGESRRAKRRKDGSAVKVPGSASSLGGEGEDEDVVVDDAEGGGAVSHEARRSASELGHQLLETLRKATNASGTLLATEFKKLPNKRQYPDYYELISQPIAFDNIRAKLDAHEYASLEEVKSDFDLCFRNAKKYNVKGSDIWNAARDLQVCGAPRRKAVDVCKALQPHMPDADEDIPEVDDDEDGDGDFVESPTKGEGEKRKAGRPPNLFKKYESRLRQGNRYSDVFMELVPKKDYPDYYRIIKKPIAFGPILKRIEHKAYASPKAFMDDVELVFSNAVLYNEDFSQIWKDAMFLQSMFRNLCADWRAEYGYTDENSAPAASGSAVPKLKLKVPATKSEPTAPNLAQTNVSAPTPPTITHPLQPQSITPSSSIPPNHVARPQAQSASTPLSTTVALPAPSYSRPTPPILPPHLRTATPSHLSRSPSVQAPNTPSLKAVDLWTYPAGRRIPIQQNGIARLTAWSVRLGINETSIGLTVQLALDSAVSPINGATNGTTIPDPETTVEIKHNAIVVAAKSGADKKVRWDVPLTIGPNTLEVRVRGSGHPGSMWRITVERTV